MIDTDKIRTAREARDAQVELGIDTERTDLAIALYEIGVDGWGPETTNAELRAWIADPSTIPGRVTKVAAVQAAMERLGETGAPRVRRGGEPASNQFGTYQVHQASDKQIGFLKRLINTKDYAAKGIEIPEGIDTISKKAASTLIDKLMGCADKADPTPVATATGGHVQTAPKRLVSDKALGYLRSLIAERDYYSLSEADRRKVNFVNGGGVPTAKGASDLIDVLKVTAYAPKSEQSAKGADLELGMYRKADGIMYRVYPARQSDRILAKRLVSDGEGGWTFEYAGMASRFVTAAERMTLDEAKAWGAQFGTCCVCAALLTDPESVANGIGPICGSRV